MRSDWKAVATDGNGFFLSSRFAGISFATDCQRLQSRGSIKVRSTFLPTDELGFLMFEAESADSVEEVGSRAAIAYERIVEAVE